MRKLGRSSQMIVAAGLVLAHTLMAQAQSAAAPPAAAPPAAAPPAAALPATAGEPASPPIAAETPAQSQEAACFPACREGYLCSAGQCISACNPPCAAAERCSGSAECLPSLPPPPPPSYLGAEPPAPPAPAPAQGAHTHDGFMLRATLGIGGGALSESYRGDLLGTGPSDGTVEYAGGGLLLSLDLGGALNDSLTVHGRLSIASLADPSLAIDGADYTAPQGLTVSTTLLGVGLSYTFMPLNLYLTGVVGVAGIGVHDDDPDTEDDQGEGTIGPGVDLDVGKEWWVGSQIGCGVALRFSFAASDYRTALYQSDRVYLGGGVVFSLTYQ